MQLLTLGAHVQRGLQQSFCVSVCVSVFSILPSRGFRHPMRGISGYSKGNAVKLKLFSSKVTSVINLRSCD